MRDFDMGITPLGAIARSWFALQISGVLPRPASANWASSMRKTIAAQSFSLGVTLFAQLALTPFLIGSWGVSKFGVWVLLTSATAYLVYLELGYTYVAKNLMVAQNAKREGAYLDSYHAAGSVVLVASALLLPTLGAAALVLSLVLSGTSQGEVTVCAILLAVHAVLQTHTLLICSGQRAEYGPALEAGFSAFIRLTEAVSILLTIQHSDSIAGAALGMCAVRLSLNVLGYATLVGHNPQYKFRRPCYERIQTYFKDSFAYLLIPFTQSLFIQMPILLIGWTLSPLQVAAYAATRTLTRSGLALGNVFFNSAGPEIARLSGSEPGKMGQLANRLILGALAFGLALAIALLVAGELGLSLLTKDQIKVVQPFYLLMVAAIVLEALWTAVFTVLGALNVHVSGAKMLFLAGLVGCMLVYPASANFGLNGAACALLAAHALVLLMSAYQYSKYVPIREKQN